MSYVQVIGKLYFRSNIFCRAYRYEEKSGDYTCADARLVYLHPEPEKEEIQIKGPISEDIRFEVGRILHISCWLIVDVMLL